MSNCLWPHGLCSPWNSPGQNTGVGSLSLLHRIFPTQGLNSGLPHCRQILYQLSHKGSPIQKVKHLPKDEKNWKNEVHVEKQCFSLSTLFSTWVNVFSVKNITFKKLSITLQRVSSTKPSGALYWSNALGAEIHLENYFLGRWGMTSEAKLSKLTSTPPLIS